MHVVYLKILSAILSIKNDHDYDYDYYTVMRCSQHNINYKLRF